MDERTVLVKEAGRVSLSQMFGLAKQEIEAIAALGFQLYEQGKVADAESIFNGLVALDSHVYYGYAGLGALALAEEKLEEATRWLTRAAELNPEDPTVHANLGEALLRQTRVEEAAGQFQRALALDPDEKDPGANRARAILNGMRSILQRFEIVEAASGE
jgi:tetratricopeptide (TPR) repeat protein